MTSRHIVVYLGPPEAMSTAARILGPKSRVIAVEPDALPERIGEATAILDASMRARIGDDLIRSAQRLRIVATATTGADHIDAAALAARGIPLRTLRDHPEILGRLTCAAEHSWALVMACARHLRGASDHVRAGGWDRTLFPGVVLAGRTLGIVGFGRLGRRMARYAAAFDMHVRAHDPFVDLPDGIEPASLDDLMSSCDIVTLHVPLADDTRGLIDRRRIGFMRPGSILINTSRGAVVDEVALVEGLERGRPAAAGFDVLAAEPDVREDPLRRYAETHANAILTPHIAGFCPESVLIAVEAAARSIVGHLDR